MPIDQIKRIVINCLIRLYDDDKFLFECNDGNGISERCLVFRFAHYLQITMNEEFQGYFVDCDFNSSYSNGHDIHGKPILNKDGTKTDRYIDIIVHRRDFNTANDFICFEFKKWNNRRKCDIDKDRNNLTVLTTAYNYQFGFLIILGRNSNTTKWTIFGRNGGVIEDGNAFPNPRQ